jgi:23S rRNA pseudouridine2605 synthase
MGIALANREAQMTDDTEAGERIAKVMARSGVASRRDAERLIVAGRVAVNGVIVSSPALDVRPTDTVTLDGKPIDAPQPLRLWLYYKPLGLVTSEKDEKGRQTVFESLPDGLPRVMSVGRLDLNSEGLLLLTNDGELKRRLELPATGWLRKYRVRVNGMPTDATFDPLRRGMVIDGEDFQPMEISLDRQKGANAWLTVGLREGKNREVRRAMAEVGLTVNRLIRVSYGPFRLNEMKPGDVMEVKARVLREQLGGLLHGLVPEREKSDAGADKREAGRTKPRHGKAVTGARKGPPRDGAPRKPFGERSRAQGDEGPRERRPSGKAAEGGARGDRPRKPYGGRPRDEFGGPWRDRKYSGDRPPGDRAGAAAEDATRSRRTYAGKSPAGAGGESRGRKPYGDRTRADSEGASPPRKAYGKAAEGGSGGERARKPYGKPARDGAGGESARKLYGDRPKAGDGDAPSRRPYGKPAEGEARARKPYAPRAEAAGAERARGDVRARKSYGGEPAGKPFAPRGDRAEKPGAPRPAGGGPGGKGRSGGPGRPPPKGPRKGPRG